MKTLSSTVSGELIAATVSSLKEYSLTASVQQPDGFNMSLLNFYCFCPTTIMRKQTSFFLFLAAIFFFAENIHAKDTVTPADIAEFGWEYVDTKVTITAELDSVYACRQPSNKGSVCPRLLFQKKRMPGIAIFKKGIASRSIKPFINKCVDLTGYVRERDIQTEGAMTTAPALVIEEIIESNKCNPRTLSDFVPD